MADLPDYAAAIDLYGHAGSQTRLVCVQEYAAPEEIDERKAKRRIREIRTIVQDVLELGHQQLFFWKVLAAPARPKPIREGR
ncbi:MAG: hypothetical protein U5O39_19150 [Gammaproteobacteria bacterium]|nr:hypothetical protein [Gammaproteobacteria bacterium]